MADNDFTRVPIVKDEEETAPDDKGYTRVPIQNGVAEQAAPKADTSSASKYTRVPIERPQEDTSETTAVNPLLPEEHGQGSLRYLAEAAIPNDTTVKRAGQGIWEGLGNIAGSVYGVGKDIISEKTPVLIPDEPGGETLLNKYVLSPAAAEKEKSLEEAKAFHESTGMPAVGHAASSLAHTTAEFLPILGPIAAHLGEKAGTGDIAGAAAEGTTYAVAPKIAEEAIRAVPKIAKAAIKPWLKAETAPASIPDQPITAATAAQAAAKRGISPALPKIARDPLYKGNAYTEPPTPAAEPLIPTPEPALGSALRTPTEPRVEATPEPKLDEGTQAPKLSESDQRGLEHRIGKAAAEDQSPEGIERAQRLVKGSNQNFADTANEQGPTKPGGGDWESKDFSKAGTGLKGLSPNKRMVIDHLTANVPHDEFLEATKDWGPKSDAAGAGGGGRGTTSATSEGDELIPAQKKGFLPTIRDIASRLAREEHGEAGFPGTVGGEPTGEPSAAAQAAREDAVDKWILKHPVTDADVAAAKTSGVSTGEYLRDKAASELATNIPLKETKTPTEREAAAQAKKIIERTQPGRVDWYSREYPRSGPIARPTEDLIRMHERAGAPEETPQGSTRLIPEDTHGEPTGLPRISMGDVVRGADQPEVIDRTLSGASENTVGGKTGKAGYDVNAEFGNVPTSYRVPLNEADQATLRAGGKARETSSVSSTIRDIARRLMSEEEGSASYPGTERGPRLGESRADYHARLSGNELIPEQRAAYPAEANRIATDYLGTINRQPAEISDVQGTGDELGVINIGGRTEQIKPRAAATPQGSNDWATRDFLSKQYPGVQHSGIEAEGARQGDLIPTSNVNAAAHDYLGRISPAKPPVFDPVEALHSIRQKLGLTSKPNLTPEEQTTAGASKPTPEDIQKLRTRSGATYTFSTVPGQMLDVHSVDITDPSGKNIGKVSATNEVGENVWTIRHARSDIPNAGLGTEAYQRLENQLQLASDKAQQPMKIQGDGVSSSAALAVWRKLQQSGKPVVWKEGRPSITVQPRSIPEQKITAIRDELPGLVKEFTSKLGSVLKEGTNDQAA